MTPKIIVRLIATILLVAGCSSSDDSVLPGTATSTQVKCQLLLT